MTGEYWESALGVPYLLSSNINLKFQKKFICVYVFSYVNSKKKIENRVLTLSTM